MSEQEAFDRMMADLDRFLDEIDTMEIPAELRERAAEVCRKNDEYKRWFDSLSAEDQASEIKRQSEAAVRFLMDERLGGP